MKERTMKVILYVLNALPILATIIQAYWVYGITGPQTNPFYVEGATKLINCTPANEHKLWVMIAIVGFMTINKATNAIVAAIRKGK